MDYPVEFVEFLNALLRAAVAALAPIAVNFVIALVRDLAARVRASISAEHWLAMRAIVATVVAAAEQSGLAGHIAAEGRAKREWALREIKRIIAERNLPPIDVDTLIAMIEAEVWQQFNAGKSPRG